MALASQVQRGHLDKHLNALPGPAEGHAAHRRGAAVGGGRWYVLVDAAKAAATSRLSLSGEHRPDFVAVSFYKMMGMPTGLGALLIRRDSAWQLDKRSFAGGSVLAVQPDRDFFKLRESVSERFEDGSPSFLAILAAAQGLEMLQALGVGNISTHTWSLRDYLAHSLTELRHSSGVPLVEIYGPPPGASCDTVGSICTFNLRRPDGQYVEYAQVEELAGLNGLSLRAGVPFAVPETRARARALSLYTPPLATLEGSLLRTWLALCRLHPTTPYYTIKKQIVYAVCIAGIEVYPCIAHSIHYLCQCTQHKLPVPRLLPPVALTCSRIP